MPDYKKLLSESQLFISKLESVAPSIGSRRPEGRLSILRDVTSHYAGIMDATSPDVVVKGLRIFCKDVSSWKFPELEPAITRYMNVLDDINIDVMKGIDFPYEIAVLQSNFGTLYGSIKVMAVSDSANFYRRGILIPDSGWAADIKKIKPQIVNTPGTTVSPATDTKLPEPTLRVRLTGDKVKGRAVERGTSCNLTVDWGLLDNTTLGELTGHELRRAREAGLQVVFVLYRGAFKVEGNKTRIATRFMDDRFETPVQFSLTAPDKLTAPGNPSVKSKLCLEIEISGRPEVRIPVLLMVVHDLSTAPTEASAAPVKVDLDKLIKAAGCPAPAAVLRINSFNDSSADLTLLQPVQVIATKSVALSQLSVANQLGKFASKMDKVAKDPIWNLLSDPLMPTATEKIGLAEPLAKAAAVGSELYEWLAMTAGMKDILSRIDALPIASRIIVHSDGVAIPWETIYPERFNVNQSDGDSAGDIDIAKFWGYRFEFETILSPAQHDLPEGATDRFEQHRNAERKLTAVMNGDIDSEKEWKAGPPVDYQRVEFKKAYGGPLVDMQITSSCADVRKLVDTQPTSGSFIYFYCHGGAERAFDPTAAEALQIDKQCLIEVADVSYDATFTGAPIVFLNSCSSGPLASVSFDSFCARFLHKGALGLITTSFAVPAPFAARFGCELILRYMNAEGTLGELLLDLRRKALNERIPIGLFYMLRGPAEVSLKSI